MLFAEPSVESLAAALRAAREAAFDAGRLRDHAEAFSRERYIDQIRGVIEETVAAPAGTRW